MPITYTETAKTGGSVKKKGFVYPVPDSVEKKQVKKLPTKSKHMRTPVPGMRLRAFSESVNADTVWIGSWLIWKEPPNV